MKKLIVSLFCVVVLFVSNLAFAQEETVEAMLDNTLALNEKGDMAGLEMSLTKTTEKLEKETGESKGDFKDKLLSSVGGLKAMIPMVSKGLVKQNALQKIISTIKLLLGAQRLSGMLGGGGSLLGQASGLKSNLGLMKMGMSALEGGAGDKMGSLLTNAMGSVTQLEKGGMGAKTAEPALKKQLGGLMDMVKGAL
jgi:hypothetical protein